MSNFECANFRDIGAFVNAIANCRLLPEKRLYRGGKINDIQDAADIGTPGTIINLRHFPDPDIFGAGMYHCSNADTQDNYNTNDRDVRRWLNKVIKLFEMEGLRYPVLIHCFSGRDRTGIVVATLLRVLKVPDEIIIEEYSLSEGAKDTTSICHALKAIGDIETYLNRVDLAKVRRGILGVGE